jgi:hypothetical protein
MASQEGLSSMELVSPSVLSRTKWQRCLRHEQRYPVLHCCYICVGRGHDMGRHTFQGGPIRNRSKALSNESSTKRRKYNLANIVT